MNLLTYPMRPVNGGAFTGQVLPGEWTYEPKYNGWRALVHVPTRSVFNRHGEPMSIEAEFKTALDAMCCTLDAGAFKWVDCEGLSRRHNIGKGTLIVLDVVPEPDYANTTQAERRRWIHGNNAILRAHHPDIQPEENDVLLTASIAAPYAPQAWEQLQKINAKWGCQFYEGIVAKRANSPYNIQLQSPDQTSSSWLKYRWSW